MSELLSHELWPASLAGRRLDRYFHVCAFFANRDELYDTLLPFIREGLEWGEKALHIWDPSLLQDHASRLRTAGLRPAERELRGQLELVSAHDVYLQGGRFDQARMIEAVDATIRAGLAAGFPRCRILGHMDWALENHPGAEDLLEYEIRVNDVLARHRQPAICVYDLNRLSARLLMDVLRAHPLALVGGVLYENPFYTPAETYLAELRTRAAARDVA